MLITHESSLSESYIEEHSLESRYSAAGGHPSPHPALHAIKLLWALNLIDPASCWSSGTKLTMIFSSSSSRISEAPSVSYVRSTNSISGSRSSLRAPLVDPRLAASAVAPSTSQLYGSSLCRFGIRKYCGPLAIFGARMGVCR